MQTVSSGALDKVNSYEQSFGSFVIADLGPEWNYPFATAVASSTYDDFIASLACNGRITISEEQFIGTGIPAILGNSRPGWKSLNKSNSEGLFITPETIEINYNQSFKSKNFWVIGTLQEHPVSFKLEIKLIDGTWVQIAYVLSNDKHLWNINTDVEYEINAVKLTIDKISQPNREAFVVEVGAVTTVIFDGDSLVDWSLLEEITAEEFLPYGTITSNEFSMAIPNEDLLFVASNSKGPFKGLLRKNVRLKVFSGVEVQPNRYECASTGVFYTDSWKAPISSMEAQVVAYDRLYNIMQSDVPIIKTVARSSIYDMIKILFNSLGIVDTEFWIDPKLISIIIPYGYYPTGKTSEILNNLSLIGNCFIYTNRENLIIVKCYDTDTSIVASFHDDLHIQDVDNPDNFDSAYDRIETTIFMPSIKTQESLLSISDIEVGAGGRVLEKASFSNAPVTKIETIKILNSINISIGEVSFGSNDLTFTLNNTGTKSEIANVQMIGSYISFIERVYGYKVDKDRRFEIKNPYIQTEAMAQSINQKLLPLISDSFAIYYLEISGHPFIEPSDVISFLANTANIPLSKGQIVRINTSYNGGLSTSLIVRRRLV